MVNLLIMKFYLRNVIMFIIKLYKIGLIIFRVIFEVYISYMNGDVFGLIWIKDIICVGFEISIDECDWR